MTARSFSMSLPRFCWRLRSLLNSAPGRGVKGGGGGGGSSDCVWDLGLGLATSETQILEHLVDAGVIGHIPAGLGVAKGPACGRIGDVHRERQSFTQGNLLVEQADGFAGIEAKLGEDSL